MTGMNLSGIVGVILRSVSLRSLGIVYLVSSSNLSMRASLNVSKSRTSRLAKSSGLGPWVTSSDVVLVDNAR